LLKVPSINEKVARGILESLRSAPR